MSLYFPGYTSRERSPQLPQVLFVFSFYCPYSSRNGLLSFLGFLFSKSHLEKVVSGARFRVLESMRVQIWLQASG